MKLNSAYIFFIASLATSGVYASPGNLRSRQNFGHDVEEEMESHINNKPVVDMKEEEKPDDYRLLQGNHCHETVMTREKYDGGEGNRHRLTTATTTTIENHRTMGSSARGGEGSFFPRID